jgi:hypothetical protein
MADVLEIKSYQYHNFSSRASGCKGVVACKAVDGKTISILFLDEQKPLLSVQTTGENQFVLYYQYNDMANIVDMLRNESPVYFIHVPTGSNNSRLSTGSEPVGEGEEL